MVSAMMGSTFATAARTCATAQHMSHVLLHMSALVPSYGFATTGIMHHNCTQTRTPSNQNTSNLQCMCFGGTGTQYFQHTLRCDDHFNAVMTQNVQLTKAGPCGCYLRVACKQRRQRCAAEEEAGRRGGADAHAHLQQARHVPARLATIPLPYKQLKLMIITFNFCTTP